MPRQTRIRPVTPSQARAYLAKAIEYLDAAEASLEAGRRIAATSLAIHAAINAADAVTGVRLGMRAAGEEHAQAQVALGRAGPDGMAVSRELSRLLPLKARAEYDPDDIPQPAAFRAVEQARRCVAVAWRCVHSL
jgi:hypothetical protein